MSHPVLRVSMPMSEVMYIHRCAIALASAAERNLEGESRARGIGTCDMTLLA